MVKVFSIRQPAALRQRGKVWAALARLRAFKSRGARPVLGNIAICMVKNEQDIIEPFLRHHAPLMDLIFVLENNSSDHTHAIIAQLAAELDNIVMVDTPRAIHGQSIFVSQALRYVQSACFADRIFFLDADEFLAVPTRQELEAQTAWRGAVPMTGRMAWRTFVVDPTSDETLQPDPILRMRYRRKTEVLRASTSKVMLNLRGATDPSIICEHGLHKLRSGIDVRLRERMLPDLKLMHLPVRSFQQLRSKATAAWISNLARGEAIAAKQGVHRKLISEALSKRDAPINGNDLAELGMRYATRYPVGDLASNSMPDDHGITTLRRYSDGRFGDADALIAAAKHPKIMHSQQLALPPLPPAGALDAPPVQYLMQVFTPKSVIEVRGATQGYDAIAAHHGAKQTALWDAAADVSPPAAADVVLAFDLPAPKNLPQAIQTAIAGAAKVALVCAFACSDVEDAAAMETALDQWAAQGWHPDLTKTLALRAVATLPHLRRNALVLYPADRANDDGIAAIMLRSISQFPHRAPPAPTGLITAAFAAPFPDLNQGYGLRRP